MDDVRMQRYGQIVRVLRDGPRRIEDIEPWLFGARITLREMIKLGLVIRSGNGVSGDPYIYALKNERVDT